MDYIKLIYDKENRNGDIVLSPELENLLSDPNYVREINLLLDDWINELISLQYGISESEGTRDFMHIDSLLENDFNVFIEKGEDDADNFTERKKDENIIYLNQFSNIISKN